MAQLINKRSRQANYWFAVMMGLGSLWLLLGFGVIWQYFGVLVNYLYYLCQSQWDSLINYFPSNLTVLIPIFILFILGRGLYLLLNRLRRTQQFTLHLDALDELNDSRLTQLARSLGLTVDKVGCLNTTMPLAFSLGVWQPKIWLSAKTVSLLNDRELQAILHHELYHCQHRDPLKLLLSHVISDMFFFVPLLRTVMTQLQLAQEMAADASTVDQMDDAVPLASALHKLLTIPHNANSLFSELALSRFNLTEKRILALVSPNQLPPWRPALSRWLSTALVAFLLIGSTALAQPRKHATLTTCSLDALPTHQLTLPELHNVLP